LPLLPIIGFAAGKKFFMMWGFLMFSAGKIFFISWGFLKVLCWKIFFVSWGFLMFFAGKKSISPESSAFPVYPVVGFLTLGF
jgi:hypothetical protein